MCCNGQCNIMGHSLGSLLIREKVMYAYDNGKKTCTKAR